LLFKWPALFYKDVHYKTLRSVQNGLHWMCIVLFNIKTVSGNKL